jgi:hypothetical protein
MCGGIPPALAAWDRVSSAGIRRLQRLRPQAQRADEVPPRNRASLQRCRSGQNRYRLQALQLSETPVINLRRRPAARKLADQLFSTDHECSIDLDLKPTNDDPDISSTK